MKHSYFDEVLKQKYICCVNSTTAVLLTFYWYTIHLKVKEKINKYKKRPALHTGVYQCGNYCMTSISYWFSNPAERQIFIYAIKKNNTYA